MKQILIFILIVVAVNSFGQSSISYYEMLDRELGKTVPLISIEELERRFTEKTEMVLLDARESEEFMISHLQGANSIGYNFFHPDSLPKLAISDTLIVYCSIGYRSEKIGEKLLAMGYKNVYNLYGGVFEWINSGKSLVNHANDKTNKVHAFDENWGSWLINGTKVYE